MTFKYDFVKLKKGDANIGKPDTLNILHIEINLQGLF